MTKLLFKIDGVLVYDNGSMYRQVMPDEVIEDGALHSISEGVYNPMVWGTSVGKTPNHFSPDGKRSFFNPLSSNEKKAFGLLLKQKFEG